MNILLYLLLLLLPLPLFAFLIKHKHYFYCLPPFIAFLGIYAFNIIGSIEVIKDESLFTYMYYYTLLLIIVLFYLFYIIVFSFGKKLYIDWGNTYQTKTKGEGLIPLLVLLWSFSFFMFYLYYRRHGLPAVFSLNLFEYVDIYGVRAEKSTNLPEGGHWYWFGFITIPAFTFVYTYILQHLNRTLKLRAIFYINLPLVLFFSSFTLHKTPFAYLLLYIFLIQFFLETKVLSIKKIMGYVVLVMGIIAVFVRLYLLDRGLADVLKILPDYFYHRICTTYTIAHAYIIQIFPQYHEYFYGKTFGNPGHIFPYEPVSLSQFLGYWVHGHLENYASPSFSQGYANFGFLGLLVIVMMMFAQIMIIQILFKKLPRDPIFLAIYVLIIPNLLGYATTNIQAIVGEIFILFSIACIFEYYISRSFVMNLGQDKKPLGLFSH